MFIFAKMIKKNKISTFFLLICTFSCNFIFAQAKQYEFIGVMIVNADNSMYSYKLMMEEKNGVISGYSISDLKGPNETKSKITGTYDKKTSQLTFTETSIISTKSKEKLEDFCMLKVTSKLKLKNAKSILDGTFRGTLNNTKKSSCGEGKIILSATENVYHLLSKVANKIDTNKVKDPIIKQLIIEVDPIKDVETIKKVTANETLKYKFQNDSVSLYIWDDGLEDDDRITLLLNGKPQLENYTITNVRKLLKLPLAKGNNYMEIRALNEGANPPNTVKVVLLDNSKKYLLLSYLKSGETANIIIE